MLLSLEIQNYAIIKHIEIDFQKGFTTITGETGAGKSILLGALSLIIGQRADSSVLNNKDKKCIVEAAFNIKDYSLNTYFEENNLDYEEVSIIRREIAPNGKSRAFINDTPVNLETLKYIGDNLIDIHSQHQNLKIADASFQLFVVDGLANHKELTQLYSEKYLKYKQEEKKLIELKNQSVQEKSDLDYLQFQYSQIDELNLQENEQNEQEEELEVLTHAEEIKSNLEKINYTISGEDINTIANLKDLIKCFDSIKNYLPNASNLSDRVKSLLLELQDIDNDVEVISNKIEFDPLRIDFINDRLNSIYTLQQKHKVETVSELLEIKKNCQNKINEIDNFDNEILDAEKKVQKFKEELFNLATTISTNRKKIIPEIETNILKYLSQIGMDKTVFKIQVVSKKELSSVGIDDITFMFSANNNADDLKMVAKVASGGELSRLMFVIKFLISQSRALPTIIFDEIDTGVSGDIADKMADIMQKMANKMQVLSITHLPQIAAKGSHHYIVYKSGTQDITTGIKLLDKQERIKEIAKMLSGSTITDAAYKNAEVLIGN